MKKQTKKQDKELEEIRLLAEEADSNQGLQLGLEDEFHGSTFQIDLVDDVQDPNKAYKVYYAIEGLLKTHLPKGDKYDDVRKFVREEKIIFLTGGKKLDANGKRGADSRQAYISTHLEVAFNILLQWLQEGGNAFDLFMKFRTLNIDRGYFEKEELSSYNQKLKKGLNWNPKDHKK